MGCKKGEPHKNGYFREMLEKYVFESEGRFASWVDQNFTEAVKELGKLQPKDVKLGSDPNSPLVMKIERVIVDAKDTDS